MSRSPENDTTLVLGFGNSLYGDDGLGMRAAAMLAERELPAGVQVVQAGMPGWELPAWLEGWPRVILIDAAQMGVPAGTWRRFIPEQVQLLSQQKTISLHETGLADGLALAQALEVLPEEIVFYCIQPETIGEGEELSPAVAAALPGLVDEIQHELWKREQ